MACEVCCVGGRHHYFIILNADGVDLQIRWFEGNDVVDVLVDNERQQLEPDFQAIAPRF